MAFVAYKKGWNLPTSGDPRVETQKLVRVFGFRHTPKCRSFRYLRIMGRRRPTSGEGKTAAYPRVGGGLRGCTEYKHLLCIGDWISLSWPGSVLVTSYGIWE